MLHCNLTEGGEWVRWLVLSDRQNEVVNTGMKIWWFGHYFEIFIFALRSAFNLRKGSVEFRGA